MSSEVRALLSRIGPADRIRKVADDESLLATGILDSLAMLRLIEEIETTHGLRVDEDELVPENFETIRRMAEFLSRKRAALR
jgi:acyl carrier protein